jgi:hypothetical protein
MQHSGYVCEKGKARGKGKLKDGKELLDTAALAPLLP